MKRLLIGISAAASLVATRRFAADFAVKQPAYTKAPVYVEPVFDWTGFYVGGNLGYSWGRSSDTSTITNGAARRSVHERRQVRAWTASSAAVRSATTGRCTHWVSALKPTSRAPTKKARAVSSARPVTCLPPSAALALVIPGPACRTLSQKIDWFGTVRGRIGFSSTPKVLLYATGGLAYGEVKSSETVGVLNRFSTLQHQCRLYGRRRYRRRDRRQLDRQARISLCRSRQGERLVPDDDRRHLAAACSPATTSRASPTTSCASASTTSSADRWWRSTKP